MIRSVIVICATLALTHSLAYPREQEIYNGMIRDELQINSDEMIDAINALNTTWKAKRNFPQDTPEHYLNQLTLGNFKPVNATPELPLLVRDMSSEQFAEQFDSRIQWPYCDTIRQIRSQNGCGSCWAFAAATVISDRICIHSGARNVPISPEDLVNCDTGYNSGCGGGLPSNAFIWYQNNGIVTGGDYGSRIGCQPYSHAPCPANGCHDTDPTPPCMQSCQPGYPLSYTQDKHYGSIAYQLAGSEQMMNEIASNGPVTALFDVYEDFYSYSSGVYRRTTNKFKNSHAVRIIGWGVEDGVKYWMVANSWGNYWGSLGGYFKILRGVNECRIESSINAALPA